jgi:hypothetical protein
MTGQEKGDCLIEVTTWIDLTAFVVLVGLKFVHMQICFCEFEK